VVLFDDEEFAEEVDAQLEDERILLGGGEVAEIHSLARTKSAAEPAGQPDSLGVTVPLMPLAIPHTGALSTRSEPAWQRPKDGFKLWVPR
jgi:hypothetical protein